MRAKKTIESRVRGVVCDVLACEPDDVTDGTSFRDDLDADSLDIIELAMGIEEHFDIQITDDDEDPHLATFGSACALVRTRLEELGRKVDGSDLPSAADLDRVAEEDKVRVATGGKDAD